MTHPKPHPMARKRALKNFVVFNPRATVQLDDPPMIEVRAHNGREAKKIVRAMSAEERKAAVKAFREARAARAAELNRRDAALQEATS